MAPERRHGRARGKSDPIDALAVARAALREPGLSRPRADEEPYRELKLLVDHRDAIVDERRRVHQRLRWHLHQLDPTYEVPLRMLARSLHLERSSRWLARQDQELQVRLARELVSAAARSTATSPNSTSKLEQRTAALAPALLDLPGCGAITAAKLLAEIGPDRPLPKRRPTRPPQRRRAPRGKLRPDPAPPTRPRRQPPTQLGALPDRDHPGPRPRARTRLPRAQTSRGQEPPRSHPLPQTTPRPRRLPDPHNEPRLDIGATLAHASILVRDGRDRQSLGSFRHLAGSGDTS